METMFLGIVVFLFLLAIFDLVVGVSNDAVNFMNSAIGAKAASFKTIIAIAAFGIFIGATLTREMRNAMVVSVGVYAGAAAVLVPAFGNHGLWAALMALNLARAVTMARLYPRAEARAA